jgi:starch synthase
MGINMSNIITTVSESYAEEIKTSYFGEGLDYVIRMNADNVYGILNGIDYKKYNPAKDEKIYFNYDINNIDKKYKNKRNLQSDMGLAIKDNVAVIALISRLVEQKGLDLIIESIDELLDEEIQFIILGTGNEEYENFFRKMADYYPEKLAVNINYDTSLAHKIYAGIDIFLMPSKFEPCGLSQLISLRYGTIPVVRETGGLNDTISPYDEKTGKGNGFSFANYNAGDMLYTIRRAIEFYNKSEVWPEIINNAMSSDFSWDSSAKKYIDLYNKAVDFSFKININLAFEEKLQQLKGVGPSLAENIIKYRKENGNFKNKEEIKEINGIGKNKYNKLQDKITLFKGNL